MLEALFIWFAWQGRNWARIVLWVLGGIGAWCSASSASRPALFGARPTGFLTSLGWFQLLLGAVGIVLLALKPSNEWYRYRGWQRANGQPAEPGRRRSRTAGGSRSGAGAQLRHPAPSVRPAGS